METLNAAELLAALGHESRLSIFRVLVEAGPEGIYAGAIGERLGLAAATLSFHLSHLSRVGLIRGQRESRFIHYSVDYTVVDDLIAYLTSNCCQGEACLPKTAAASSIGKRRDRNPSPTAKGPCMIRDRVFNVLFLCTGNSARSILAESILNLRGQGHFRAYSAGSHPTGTVHPYAIDLLNENSLPVTGLRSKNWDEFAGPEAPVLDFVFTVCDQAAGETCPVWPGQPMTAHWGVEDPAAAPGDEAAKRAAMYDAYHRLNARISLFISLPFAKLDGLALQSELDAIGKLRGQAIQQPTHS